MSDARDFNRNFQHHPPTVEQIPKYQILRNAAQAYAELVAFHTVTSREQSLALTKIEEAMFWANSAIARNG